MTNPETYVYTRYKAVFWYIYKDQVDKNEILKTGVKSSHISALLRNEMISMETADIIYQAASKLAPSVREVEGEPYEKWKSMIIKDIDQAVKDKGMNDANIKQAGGVANYKGETTRESTLWKTWEAVV